MKNIYGLKKDKADIKMIIPGLLEKLFQDDPDVVYLDADLMNSIGTLYLMDKYKGRSINMGIQESNMVGVAAGMASEGKKPYIHSFGPFVSRRVYDQVFISAGYAKNDIRIIGSDPGVTAAYNGGTHMPFEDIALYRAIPSATIFDITDANQFSKIMYLVRDNEGVTYIRTPRKWAIGVYDEHEEFEIGCGKVLSEGDDVTIIASGIMVAKAIKAREVLADDGIAATVIDPVTIKPLDKDLIIKYAKKTNAIITAENANVNGGLADAVASAVCENYPVLIERVAVFDEYGEVGSIAYLEKRFNLTTEAIVEKAKKIIKRKVTTVATVR